MYEKRNFHRVPFGTEVQLRVNGRRMTGGLRNISLKGALVHFPKPMRLNRDRIYELSIFLNPGVILTFNAEAVYFSGKDIGLQCAPRNPDTFSHLVRLLELNAENSEQIEKELRNLIGIGRKES